MTDYDRPVALPTLEWGLHGSRRALLLHGLSSSAASWWRIADDLAGAGYHVTAPDLRGHGNAPHTASYRLNGYAADLWELGDDWDIVVGHSLGGTVGSLVCAREDFARRLVLLDPVLIIPEDRFDSLLADHISEFDAAGDPELFARRNPGWHPEDAAIKALATLQTSRYVVERTLNDNRPWWYLDLLGDVHVSTTIVGADPARGALFDPTIGQEMAHRNAQIRTMVVAGAGHSVHHDAPDAVLGVLLS